MGDVQDPQARVGGAHTGGNNPYPGGKIETGDATSAVRGPHQGP